METLTHPGRPWTPARSSAFCLCRGVSQPRHWGLWGRISVPRGCPGLPWPLLSPSQEHLCKTSLHIGPCPLLGRHGPAWSGKGAYGCPRLPPPPLSTIADSGVKRCLPALTKALEGSGLGVGPTWSGHAPRGGEGGQRALGVGSTQANAEKQIGKGLCLSREPGGDAEPGGSKDARSGSPGAGQGETSVPAQGLGCQEGQGSSPT